MDKSRIQSAQYDFPYHYLVDLDAEDFVRNLDWGLDYLTYMKKVIALVKKYVGSDVLDVGCGDGFLLNNLAQDPEFPADVKAVGIDVDGKAIRFARAFGYGLSNVTFVEQDLGAYEDRFGLITTVETFEHIPDADLDPFIRSIDRLLEPGGRLIISVPSNLRDPIEKHFRHYDLSMLQSYFPGYDLLEVHYVSARKSLVYQIVAKLLANRYLNLNFGLFKSALMGVHDRFTSDVDAERGAHVVAVFEKP